MKNIFLFLLIMLCCCGSTHGQKVSITGKMADYYSGDIQLFKYNNYVESKVQFLSQVTADKEGRFAIHIELPKAQSVMISYGKGSLMTLWLEPNDSIFVEIAKSSNYKRYGNDEILDKGQVIFSGRGAEINNFLFAANLMIYDPQTHQRAQSLSLPDYMAFLDSIQNARLLLRETLPEGEFSSEAEEFLQGEIVYSTFYNKAMVEVYKQKKDHQDSLTLEMPEFYSYWKSWKFPSERALASPGYRQSLSTYFNRKAREQMGRPVGDRNKEKFLSIAFNSAERELGHLPLTREYIEAFLLYRMFSFVQSKDSITVLATRFRTNFPRSEYYPMIEKRRALKNNINKPAPEIVALDTNNKLINLNDFKGKLIYVDIWASWCGPCLKEFPHAIKLAEKLKDKIHIVYLNIHDTDKAWRKVIQEKGLHGVHLRADKEMTAKIELSYNISSLPRYLLIDQKGFLFNESAKPPSEVEEDIIQLLK